MAPLNRSVSASPPWHTCVTGAVNVPAAERGTVVIVAGADGPAGQFPLCTCARKHVVWLMTPTLICAVVLAMDVTLLPNPGQSVLASHRTTFPWCPVKVNWPPSIPTHTLRSLFAWPVAVFGLIVTVVGLDACSGHTPLRTTARKHVAWLKGPDVYVASVWLILVAGVKPGQFVEDSQRIIVPT